jgi:predicted dehydrogenase
VPASSPSRRTFLQSSAAAAAVALPAGAARANDKLNVGVIGCGLRGTQLAREVIRNKHNVAAACDVAEFRLEAFQKVIALSGQDEKPAEFVDYRRLLQHKGLDAVVIATPDHHHRDQLIAACLAGKDAYCETPLTKSLAEGKEMLDAVKKNKRIVQAGSQWRSGAHWKRCKETIDSNDFGNLVWAKAWDCRNWFGKEPNAIPAGVTKEQEALIQWDVFQGREFKREFNLDRYWGWRWYWEYGGGLITEVGSHLLDLVQWLAGAEAPRSVVAHGWRYHFKDWDTPDVAHAAWDYGKFSATLDAQCLNGADGAGLAFYGTKMTLVADLGKEVRLYHTADRIAPDAVPAAKWAIEPETTAHVKNWLDCCLSRREPNAPVELGHKAAVPAHIANLAYRLGRKIHWDADKQEVIGG